MTSHGPVVDRCLPGAMDEAWVEPLRAMLLRAYEGMTPPLTPEADEASRRQAHDLWVFGRGGPPDTMLHVVRERDHPVAAAISFTRRVIAESGPITVLALSSVATDPPHRGHGHGLAVVRDAFARLASPGPRVCLFQTGLARVFYEKLGARCVDNWFFDGTSAAPKANPWSDRYVMIYPAAAAWPTGPIDLNGPKY
ncbi:MAG: GNAT family N-acetyltransferase [Planctomycetota bacterium]